ncbi:hypothetical protein SPRG_00581 [Saprolegnia parasitica CBS 223.65]|uniref:Uncharacterized protein n=1 Tax=Saprolegnia parasitica (strain CBS 223.65) TaxID=695850 RepID=A0A067CVG7_SAPPC|nr:hypothetical protein SPRG_00581 [Saprolegnia parasitica CBS 223.65]KDO34518.1 hypothetical protein SPRG_00581 [Saprolegnia parasitica CBS 223.65]|eukprot:XP_012194196.1 hypothetical protein SPRG_00581 [Saprolegnia parasitica CBS 223.65]
MTTSASDVMWSIPALLASTPSGREVREYYVDESSPTLDTNVVATSAPLPSAPRLSHALPDAPLLPCWGVFLGALVAMLMTLIVYKLVRGKRKGRHLYRTVPLAQLVTVCEAGEGATEDYVLIEV